jgi:rhodanese-related sulfurtransferase
MKVFTLATVLAVLTIPQLVVGGEGDLAAPLCGKCHQTEANMIRGVLKRVSLEDHSITLDSNGHEETVTFSHETMVRNLPSLHAIDQFKGEGLRVFFVASGNGRNALQIARFDPMSLMTPGKVLDTRAMENILSHPDPPTLIDIRSAEDFMAGHIQDAINIPAAQLEKMPSTLPANRKSALIIYGGDPRSNGEAAVLMMANGYNNVSIYAELFSKWDQSHTTTCSMGYARKRQGHGVYFIDLLRDKASVIRPDLLRGDLTVLSTSLAGMKNKLPSRLDSLIVVSGPDQENAVATLKSMGYSQVRVLRKYSKTWSERVAEKNATIDCY